MALFRFRVFGINEQVTVSILVRRSGKHTQWWSDVGSLSISFREWAEFKAAIAGNPALELDESDEVARTLLGLAERAPDLPRLG